MKLSAQDRLKAIKQVRQEGKPVAQVCRDFSISRKTFYKWLNRYQQSDLDNKIKSLEDKEWKILNHPKRASLETENKIISLISSHPELSSHKIANFLGLGNHLVQNVLKRNNLNLIEQRLAFAEEQVVSKKVPFFTYIFDKVHYIWDTFVPTLAPAPPPSVSKPLPTFRVSSFSNLFKSFLISLTLSSIFSLGLIYWFNIFLGKPLGFVFGIILSTIALFFGSFFFIYSFKYYLSLVFVLSFSQKTGNGGQTNHSTQKGIVEWLLGGNGNGNGHTAVGLESDLNRVVLQREPFVSVHIPLYNEKNVVRRLIAAVTSFDYPNYEVILCDDSTDETTDIIREYMQGFLPSGQILEEERGQDYTLSQVQVASGIFLKHLHRFSRSGFKGGALKLALSKTNPKTEFVSVFDADFVPYPDSLTQFLKYFQLASGTLDFRQVSSKPLETGDNSRHLAPTAKPFANIAAVQGYQWHVLNKSENWITRGVRSEYSGSYVIERSAVEIFGGLKMIAGSVYIIRKDVLEEIGWGTSITEDFELTLRLYEKGYKVVYTPYIQAPAECVSTIKRLARQRMRWAEGHSHNIRKMFKKLIISPNLSLAEKLEFLYLSPYYLQAFFFVVGTLSWLIAETIFLARLPFWTEVWGWSLVLTNLFSLPLLNTVGLFLEESEERDYLGILSFLALSYILVPFQAYAALKGFLEEKEGPWFRTPKTGRITDIFTRARLYRLIAGILPGRIRIDTVKAGDYHQSQYGFRENLAWILKINSYLPVSAFVVPSYGSNLFKIKPKRMRWYGRLAVVAVILLSLFANYLGFFSPIGKKEAGKLAGNVPSAYAKDFEKLKVGDQIEIVESRNENSKTYLKKTGKNTSEMVYEGQVGPIHYKDKSGKWQDIDLSLSEDKQKGIFRNDTNSFVSEFSNGDNISLPIASFSKDGLKVSFIFDKNSFEAPRIFQESGRTKVIYPNFFDGVDLVFSISEGRVSKEFVLNQYQQVKDFRFSFILKIEGGSAKFDKGKILLEKEGKVIGEMPSPRLYEISLRPVVSGSFGKNRLQTVGPSGSVFYTVESIDANTYRVSKNLSYSAVKWMADPSRVYPIATDSIINFQVNAADNDGADVAGDANFHTTGTPDDGTPWSDTATFALGGKDASANAITSGLRFTSVNVPQGAVVKSAKFDLRNYWNGDYSFNVRTKVYGSKQSDVSIFSNSNLPRNITRTTAFSEFDSVPETIATDQWLSETNLNKPPEIVDVVAEIINQAGWASGNSLALIFVDNGSTTDWFWSPRGYESGSANAAKLTIVYSTSGATTIEQQINIIDQEYSTSSITDSPTDNSLGIIAWQSTAFTSATVYFEAVIKCSSCSAGGTAVATLYTAAGSAVSGSDVSTSSSSYSRVRSGDITSSLSSSTYTVRIRRNATLGSAFIKAARLIIIQTVSSDSKITDTASVFEVGNNDTSTNTTYNSLTDPKYYYFDSSRFIPRPSSIIFDATISNSTAGQTAYAILAYNADCSGSTIAASELSTTGTTWARVAATISLTSGSWVGVCIKTTSGGTARIANAHIIITQSDSSGISASEIYHTYVNTLATDSDSTYTSYDFINRFDPADFSGGSFTFFFEADLKASAGTAYAQLYNLTGGSAITSSEVTTTQTSYQRVRSGNLTFNMPSSASDLDTQIRNSATNTTSVSGSVLIIQAANLSSNVIIEQQINIIDQTAATTSTTDTPTNNSLGLVLWDGTKYSGEAVYFEALLQCVSCTGGNARASATLYSSGGTAVTGSTITSTSASGARVRSSDISSNLTDNTSYTVRFRVDATSGTAKVRAARLIVVQSSTTMITDTQTQVEIGNSETTTSSSYVGLTNVKYYLYDSSKFNPAPTVYFEATMRATAATTAYAILADSIVPGGACNGQLASSEVSVTGATWTRVRSSAITLTRGSVYGVCIRNSTSGQTAGIANAKIIIEQSDTTGGIKALETVQQQINTLATDTDSTYTLQSYFNRFDPANFKGGNFNIFYEVDLKTSAGTAYAQLFNVSGSYTVGPELTTTTTSDFARLRSSEITSSLPGVASDLDTQLKNSATNTTSASNSWLIIQISNLQIPENLLFFLPLALFIPVLLGKKNKIGASYLSFSPIPKEESGRKYKNFSTSLIQDG